MTIDISAQSDGTSLRTGTYSVVKVLNGSVVMTGSAGANGNSAAAADYGYIDGDATVALAGLDSWVPSTDALASTTFKTVNRGQDARALGGIRINASGLRITEAFIQAGDDVAVLVRQDDIGIDRIFPHIFIEPTP